MRINIGAVIVSVFALVWAAMGASDLPGALRVVAIAAAAVISGAVVYLGSTVAPTHPAHFHPAAYNIAVALEVIFIIAAVTYLRRTDRKALVVPVISIIVGLHFFGMVPALGSNEYWWIGIAMCLWPLFTILALPQTTWRRLVGFGCAFILWASVLWSLVC